MKLYILKGFETMTYSTWTFFIATSKEEALKLCHKVYDELMPKYWRSEEIEEFLYERKREWEDNKKKKLKNLKDKIDKHTDECEKLGHSKMLDRFINEEKYPSWVLWRKNRDIINRLYYDEHKIYPELVKEKEKLYEASLAISSIHSEDSKENMIKNWMSMLHIVETDSILLSQDIDGD